MDNTLDEVIVYVIINYPRVNMLLYP